MVGMKCAGMSPQQPSESGTDDNRLAGKRIDLFHADPHEVSNRQHALDGAPCAGGHLELDRDLWPHGLQRAADLP
jgi:hypothetical protein